MLAYSLFFVVIYMCNIFKESILKSLSTVFLSTILEGAWIKKRGGVLRHRRIRSEKLREHQYREGYARYLEDKGVEWNGDNNVEHMWEQVKRAMIESGREVCGSVKIEEKNQRL